jgi:hypothetical protein
MMNMANPTYLLLQLNWASRRLLIADEVRPAAALDGVKTRNENLEKGKKHPVLLNLKM